MKITEIKGDLFAASQKALMHGCNAQAVMGSGVAKIVREKYPTAYRQYLQQAECRNLIMGSAQFVDCGDRIIINAITQKFYGRDGKRYVSYDAVADAMKLINQELPKIEIFQVAMPMIGAGLGGGDWSVISAVIEAELTDVEPFVYIL